MALLLSICLTPQGCDYLPHRGSSAATLRRPRPGLRFPGRERESSSEGAPLVKRAFTMASEGGVEEPSANVSLRPYLQLLRVTVMLATLVLSF